jgi:hypothetical protein
MSGKAFAQLATVVFIAWCITMLGFVGALWGALTSGAGWSVVGLCFLPALALLVLGQSLAAAAKRRGVNPTTWEPYPDGRAPERVDSTRSRFIMSALRQMIVDDPAATKLDGVDLSAADELLRSYHETREANWGLIWRDAARTRSLPMYGEPPYWADIGPGGRPVPVSYLAFWDTDDRLRVARDPRTARYIAALATSDPDSGVARVARLNLPESDASD